MAPEKEFVGQDREGDATELRVGFGEKLSAQGSLINGNAHCPLIPTQQETKSLGRQREPGDWQWKAQVQVLFPS